MNSDEHNNLILIIANEEGMIKWDSMNLDPYLFATNFLLNKIKSSPDPTEVGKNYIFDENISKKIKEESFKIYWSPIERIKVRKHGFEIGDPVARSFLDFKYYKDLKTNKSGYLFLVSKRNIKNLKEAGIEYLLKKQTN